MNNKLNKMNNNEQKEKKILKKTFSNYKIMLYSVKQWKL